MSRSPFAFALLAAALAAAPAAAADGRIGARTVSPEQLLSELGQSGDEAELERAVAEAAKHPLGTAENPVRVGGPQGERAYIARLHCADGSRPRVGQRANGGVGAFGSIVDLYPLDCGAVTPGRFNHVMDMYHEEHRETQAPAGFGIDPL